MHLSVLPNLYVIRNILASGELLQVFDKGSILEQEEQINAAGLDYLLLIVFVTEIKKENILIDFAKKFRQIDVFDIYYLQVVFTENQWNYRLKEVFKNLVIWAKVLCVR